MKYDEILIDTTDSFDQVVHLLNGVLGVEFVPMTEDDSAGDIEDAWIAQTDDGESIRLDLSDYVDDRGMPLSSFTYGVTINGARELADRTYDALVGATTWRMALFRDDLAKMDHLREAKPSASPAA